MHSKMILRKRNLNVPDGKTADHVNGITKRKQTTQILLNVMEQRQVKLQLLEEPMQVEDEEEEPKMPDFDEENKHDLTAVADYAKDIFNYYKYREHFFKVSNYMEQQPNCTLQYRATVINWLVEVQETFELNHESLYLAVKVFDMYLDRVPNVPTDQLQLIASVAAFLASKFDERSPPLIDDFIYISQNAFDRQEMIEMERNCFRTIGYELGAPISYRFLRRLARVSKTDMQTLTLARYILETSLLYLDFCRVSESLMAAASYLLAIRMKQLGDWTLTLEQHSGYAKEQVEPLVVALNHMVIKRKVEHPTLNTIYKKYCHEIFFEVALIESLPDQMLFSEPTKPPIDLLL